MLSKNLIKLSNSLSIKKYRQQHKLFIAEGQKLVADLLQMKIKINHIITSDNTFDCGCAPVSYATQNEMKKISNFKTPSDIIALVEMPEYSISTDEIAEKLSLALDEIQDPGNMGTIIRIANWFGIRNIICSTGCVDVYNPKVVQSSMGAIMGMKIHYTNLPELIVKLKKTGTYKVYGTFMAGENIYNSNLTSKGMIVMGNEGKGISSSVKNLVDCKLSIPSNSQAFAGSESLNVAVATGIIVSEFSRQNLIK